MVEHNASLVVFLSLWIVSEEKSCKKALLGKLFIEYTFNKLGHMGKIIPLDAVDKVILSILQQDAEASVAYIAEQVGLTSTPCWRRIQRLQDKGVLKRKVALLNPSALGLDLTVFVQIKAPRHDEAWLSKFATQASALEEIVEFYRLSGEYDYLLKVIVRDMSAFDHFYKRLIKTVELGDVTSSFAMEQIKYSTALPLLHV